MKKFLFVIIFILSYYSGIHAQSNIQPYDMLLSSQNFSWGTARAMGMAGSFGALGGDQTSLSVNPAGIGVYRSSEFTITPSLNYNNSVSKFFGNTTDDFSEKFNLGNIGYIYTYNTNKEIGWVSASFGISYNRLNDFNRNVIIKNPSATSSLLDEFVYYANDEGNGYFPIQDLTDYDPSVYYEGIAAETYLLSDTMYLPDVYWHSDFSGDHTYGQLQQRMRRITGGIGEYDFSFGANYSHKLYIGFTLGIQRFRYEEDTEHEEIDRNGTVPYLSSFTFTEHFKLYGLGYNFKFGLIYRPIEIIRLGAAIHTPTFFNNLSSDFYTSISANYDVDIIYNTITGQYDNYSEAYTYARENENRLRTPWKFIGSLGLQLSQFGLINIDYERINYSNMRLSGDALMNQNEDVKNLYKAGNNLRIGAEGKIGDMSLRAGYAFNSSPFKDSKLKDINTNTYSLGIGYRGKSMFVDFAYLLTTYPSSYTLYNFVEREDGSGNVYPLEEPVIADIDYKLNRFVLTVGFKF